MSAATAPTHKRRTFSQTLLNYWVDIFIFFAFIIDYNLNLTGLPIHEWLGIAFGFAIIYHLLLHWEWIVNVTKKIFGRLPTIQRIKYIVDIALFVVMFVVVVTGLFISDVAMEQLGLPTFSSRTFDRLHHTSSELSVLLVGLHLALDWKWIVSNTKKYILAPIWRLGGGKL